MERPDIILAGLTGEGLIEVGIIDYEGVLDLRERVVKFLLITVFLSLLAAGFPLGSTYEMS